MKLALVGSRTYENWHDFQDAVVATLKEWDTTTEEVECIISGGAKGADSLAERFAREHNIKMVVFKPEWQRLGRAAGLMRNTDIVNACTHVIAFPSPSGSGTQDSIRKAKAAKKVVAVYEV